MDEKAAGEVFNRDSHKVGNRAGRMPDIPVINGAFPFILPALREGVDSHGHKVARISASDNGTGLDFLD